MAFTQTRPAAPLVTVALPVATRLQHLPQALACVRAQHYPNLELLVSDNGLNGRAIPDLVNQHYGAPYTFRQNPRPVSVVDHFNRLLAAASGEYFVLLCDDDHISPEFVSELASRLERTPAAHVALARPETMDAAGGTRRTFDGYWPEQLRGDEFVLAWTVKRLRLMSTITHMSRTASARACGGYADLPRALYSDNVLLLKLALLGDVAFGQRCAFRWRVDDASTGFSASYHEVAGACRGFLRLLDHDPDLARYAARHDGWTRMRRHLRQQCGSWYFYRWRDRYGPRLSRGEWLRAGFALPYIPTYYRDVAVTLARQGKQYLGRRLPFLVRLKQRLHARNAGEAVSRP